MKKIAIFAFCAVMLLTVTGCKARPIVPTTTTPPVVTVPTTTLPTTPPTTAPTTTEQPRTTEPTQTERTTEAVLPAITNWEQLGTLDGTKKGWGPGTHTDDTNRPIGATAYQDLYGAYNAYFIAPNTKTVYLTFDEGYENGFTPSILDTLREKNVKAVFFITYPYAKNEPDLVRRMVDEGHILGNHSTKHLSFPDMTAEDAADDITQLHEYVKINFGYSMSLFRPPMGEFSERTLALTQSLNYSSIFWSFAYRDWEVDNQPLTIEATDAITRSCHPGAIYLLHAVSQTNAEVLPDIIDNIRSQGYEFGRFDWK